MRYSCHHAPLDRVAPLRDFIRSLQSGAFMARHNREASGSDQRGFEYIVSYQPDWLRQVKVTRTLDSGRQSTKTLLVNPDNSDCEPGQQVRTAIRCEAQGMTFEVSLRDPKGVIRRVVVETGPADSGGAVTDADVQFSIERRF
jgi:hypothetical protein